MQSVSKTPVPRPVGQDIVHDAFGPAVGLVDFVELTDGWFNAAYELGLDDGRRLVLKVAPPPHVTVLTYEHGLMRTEVMALRLVRQRTSAPAPEVVWFDTTARRLPSDLFLMEHMPGVALSTLRSSLSMQQQQDVDGQLAGFLREMNEIVGPAFGYPAPSSPTFERWSEAFVHMLDDVLSDGSAAGVVLPAPYDALHGAARRHLDALDEATTPCLVCWDLWDGNVFVDPGSLRVTGVFDFERALWGDPLMEGQFRTRADNAQFLEAYGRTVLDLPGARIRRHLYDLYLFLIVVIEAAYRHYPSDELERWGRGQLTATIGRLGL